MKYLLDNYIAPAFWAFIGLTFLTGGDILVTVVNLFKG